MNHYYKKGSFTINWGVGKGASRHCRKRLMAILRMSSSVLGLSRKGLGLGMLGVGGRIALASIVISSAVVVGTQNAEAYAIGGGKNSGRTDNAVIAIGNNAQTMVSSSVNAGLIAIGNTAIAGASSTSTTVHTATAIGSLARASGNWSNAMGYGAKATATRATAIGREATASGENAVALGAFAKASSTSSLAIGDNAKATAVFGVAMGYQASAAESALALGYKANASQLNSLALGSEAQAAAASSVAVGHGAKSAGPKSIAIGYQAVVGVDSDLAGGGIAIGELAKVTSAAGLAVGRETEAANAAAAFGLKAKATETGSLALGREATASAGGSTAIGSQAISSAQYAVALGRKSEAGAISALAFGTNAHASGEHSISIGTSSSVSEAGGVALGQNSVANTAAGIAGYIPIGAGTSSSTAVAATTSTLAAVAVGDAANGNLRQITGVAAGTNDTDVVNVAQLKAVSAAASGSFELSAGGKNMTSVGSGDAIDLNNEDGNIVVSKSEDSNDVTFDLADDITAESVTTGNAQLNTAGLSVDDGTNKTTYGANGFIIDGGPSVTADGFDAGGKTIANVAAGDVSADSTDAINGSQLFATNQIVEGLDGRVDLVEGNVSNIQNDITNISNVTQEIAEGKSGIVQRSPFEDDVAVLTAVGHDGDDPGAAQKLTNLAAGDVSENSSDAINGSQLFASNEKIDTIAANTSAYLGGGADVANGVAPSFTVQDKQYNNIGDAVGAVDSNLTTLHNSVVSGTAGIVQRSPGEDDVAVLTAVGHDGDDPGAAQKLTNLAAGDVSENSSDAINGSQLFATNQIVEGLDGRVDIVEGNVSNIQNDITNISNVTQEIAEGKSGVVQRSPFEDVAVLTADGGNGEEPGAAQKLTNLAAGDVSENSRDAINGSQLFASNEKIDTIAANTSAYLGGGADVANGVAPSFTVQDKQYNNIGDAVGAVDSNLTTLHNSVVSGTAGIVQRSPFEDDVAVLTAVGHDGDDPGAAQKLTNLADGDVSENSSDAINGSQLFATNQIVEGLDGRVDIVEGNVSNIQNDITNISNVTQEIAEGKSGVVQRSPFEDVAVLTADGGNGEEPGAAQKLTNLAAGDVSEDSRDAINGSQLFASNEKIDTIAANTSAYLGGGADVANGVAPSFTVQDKQYNNIGDAVGAVDSNLTTLHNSVVSGTAGIVQRSPFEDDVAVLIAVGHDGEDPGAAQKLTNLAAGDVSADSSDAINGSQLFATNQIVEGLDGRVDIVEGNVSNIQNDITNISNVTQEIAEGKSGVVQRSPFEDVAVLTADGGNGEEPGAAQKLTNLAAGDVSEDSRDAINGSQLFASNEKIDTIAANTSAYLGGGADVANGVAPSFTVQDKQYNNIGDAVGAVDSNLTTLHNSVVSGTAGIVQRSPFEDDVAVLTAVGHDGDDPGAAQKLTNLAAGDVSENSSDAINGSQLFATNQIVEGLDGRVDIVEGNVSNIQNDITNISNVTQEIAEGKSGVVQRSPFDDVAVLTAVGGNGEKPGAAQKLTNLAAGDVSEDSSDAINGSQLFASNEKIDTIAANTSAYLGGGADVANGVAPSFTVQDKQYNNIGDAVGAVDSNLTTLHNSVVSGTAGIVQRSPGEDDVAVLTAVGHDGEKPGAAQKLTNLAAGNVSEDSSDAINGSQLFATNQIVEGLDGRVDIVEGNVSNIQNDITNISNVTQEIAEGKSGVVQRSPFEDVAVLTADGGNGEKPGAAQKLTNLAAGDVSEDSSDAINGSQLFASNEKIDTIAANTSAYLGGGADVANGVAPSFTVQGNEYNNIGDAVGAVDNDLTTLHNSVVSGTAGIVQRSPGEDDVAVLTAVGGNGEKPGAAQKLTNLAAGKVSEDSTDAVNGSQIYKVSTRIAAAFGGGATVNPDGSISAPIYTVQDNQYNNIGDAVGAVDSNLTTLHNSVVSGAAGVVQRSPFEDVAVLTADGGNGEEPGAAQKLTNLADGKVSEDSSDAINGSQLFASYQRMDLIAANTSLYLGGGADVVNGVAPTYTIDGKQFASVGSAFDAVDGSLQALDGRINAINNGTNSGTATGDDSVAAGDSAVADGDSSVAIGDDSHAVGDNSVAVGKDANSGGDSSIAVGENADAQADNSVAIGKDAVAKNEGDVALGSGSVTSDAVATKDLTINGKTYDVAGTDPKNTVSVGDVGSERTITNVAAGRVSETSTDAVNGSQLHATKQAIEDLGGQVADATTATKNAVQYDTDSNGNRLNSLTLQGGDENAPVVLSNVAAGTKDTDAVNVKQLTETSEQTLATAKDYSDIKSEETLVLAKNYTQSYVDERQINTLSEANRYTDEKFGMLSSEIGDVRKEARQAAAIGLAAASLRYDDRPGKLSAAIGGGTWRGAGAAAFGLGYTSQDQRVRANVSATTAGGHWGVGAGLSFTLN